MSYQLNYESESKMIILTYTGEVRLEDRMQAALELISLVKEKQPHSVNLLVDSRKIKNKLSPAEEENFGKYIASNEVLKSIKKIALVHADSNHISFVQCYAYADGLNIVSFASFYEAKSWINGDLP